MSSGLVRAALVGLGPIGVEVGRALTARQTIALLGGADPRFVGDDLGVVLGGKASGQAVSRSAVALYQKSQSSRGRGDVALICTGSRLIEVASQIEEAIDAGMHVVSTCEELAFPYLRHAELAKELDARARAKQVSVLGTGVNPGMVMDRLVLAAVAACVHVDRVRVERVVDASKRRARLRAKVGAGLTPEEFGEGVSGGRLGHVGLAESAAMVARGLGVPALEVPETIEPIIAKDEREGVPVGNVLGVHQRARVVSGGRVVVELELKMYVGAKDPHDRIVIDGDPPVDVLIRGGFQGDRATVGTVVNAMPYVIGANPGLHTVTSLPLFGVF